MTSIKQKKSLENESGTDQAEGQPWRHILAGYKRVSRVGRRQNEGVNRQPDPKAIGSENQRAEKIQMHQEN
jgi:hypothetical protein